MRLTYTFEVVFDLEPLRERHPDDDQFVEAVKESVAEFISEHHEWIERHPLVASLNRTDGQ